MLRAIRACREGGEMGGAFERGQRSAPAWSKLTEGGDLSGGMTNSLTVHPHAGDVVRWDALSSAGSGALQQKRCAEAPGDACKRAKSTPDLSQTPSSKDATVDIPLFSKPPKRPSIIRASCAPSYT